MSNSLRPHELKHTSFPCPSPTPVAYSNSCTLSRWRHPTISSYAIPFFHPQSYPASGSFPRSQFKASILWHSALFIVQLSHPYMTTGKILALTIQTFVSKVMSLLLNTLFRFVIALLPRSNCLLISWLQSPSTVILESKKIKSERDEGLWGKQPQLLSSGFCGPVSWSDSSFKQLRLNLQTLDAP